MSFKENGDHDNDMIYREMDDFGFNFTHSTEFCLCSLERNGKKVQMEWSYLL